MAGRLIAALLASFVAGAAQAEILDEVWRDPARSGRALPVRLYLPDGAGPHPVVIFTPGLGGDRESAGYLGAHWAGHGYLALFLQHAGTDSTLTPEQLRRAGVDAQALLARYRDIPFAVSTLLNGPHRSRIEPARLAIAGHSLGAVGAAVAIGRRTAAGTGLVDPRLNAAILMSPTPGPGGDAAENFRAVTVPVLHLTGTEDRDESVPRDVTERFKPFAAIKGRPQALVVFLGGDHLVFSATPSETLARPGYRPIQTTVQTVTTRFLDAILRRDRAARAWVFDGGMETALKGEARVETAR